MAFYHEAETPHGELPKNLKRWMDGHSKRLQIKFQKKMYKIK